MSTLPCFDSNMKKKLECGNRDKNWKTRIKWLSSFAKYIKKLKSNNKEVIIVSSGAIALGCKKMKFNKTNLKLDKSQAIASIGQIELMNLFKKIFNKIR